MTANDPIADTLTRIRNAHMRSYKTVTVMHSKMIGSILEILKVEGYVEDFAESADDKGFKTFNVGLKYQEGRPAIRNLKRISKPGLRKYIGYKNIPRVLNGLGISILSTPQGVVSGSKAKADKLGGELLCTIY